MAVKIRLTRTGKKKQPSYRVVVMDGRKPRDGKYIEQIGRYDARQEPSLIEIDNERALDWLHKGAQPTERAQKLLEISGAWAQFRVDKGEIHTVGEHQSKAWPGKVHVVGEPEETVSEDSAEAPAGESAEAAAEPPEEVASPTSEDLPEDVASMDEEATAPEPPEEATAPEPPEDATPEDSSDTAEEKSEEATEEDSE